MIKRPGYLDKLFLFKDKPLIKIITGVRRSGKSTLFELYQDELLRQGVSPKQIQIINMEDLENEPLKDHRKLYQHITANLVGAGKNYVFLDEIQNVPEYGKVVDSLYLKKKADIYLTGSNSKMQSKNLANQIERQYVTIHMFPLSFSEYISEYPNPHVIDRAYDDYIQYGSFPMVLNLINNSFARRPDNTRLRAEKEFQQLIKAYLSDLYDKIVLKDIVENKGISNTSRLESVIRFLADNIGSETSINNISKTMTADGRKIDAHTAEKFIDAFCDSFILYKAGRYDVKGKKLLKTLYKYYLVDTGLRYLLLGDKKTDTGHILENVVYLELLRRGYNVYIGKVDDREIDFVAEGSNGTEYYQVTQTVRDKKTLTRELAPLNAIHDHNPKFLLTRDYEPSISHNGIRQLNVLEWLLGG
jgi:predicted AAA+ superfamily ATPase